MLAIVSSFVPTPSGRSGKSCALPRHISVGADKLDELRKSILGELLELTLANPKGVNATRFRAERYKHLDILDSLESDKLIERRNDSYVLKLLAIVELSDSHPEAKNLLAACEHIFTVLRQFYREHPGDSIDLNRLSEAISTPRENINIVLSYMVEAPIFGGRSVELDDEDALVYPAEEILRHESFQDVLKTMYAWRSKSFSEAAEHSVIHDLFRSYTENFEYLLHPVIAEHALQQYNNGHLRDAVLNSVIAVFDLIRDKTGLKDDGDKLIGKAFSLTDPYLILSEIGSESGQSDQKLHSIWYSQVY